MFLSHTKINNLIKTERHSFKFYKENLLSSYKYLDIESDGDYKTNEIPAVWFVLLHLIDPICQAIKLIINLCRTLIALLELVACYISGEGAKIKNSAKDNLENTAFLVVINFTNILMSILAYIPRLIKTIVDVFSENGEVVNTISYKREDRFFKNILDVFGYNIPGDPTSVQKVAPENNNNILTKTANYFDNKFSSALNALESNTYDCGF